MRDIAEQLAFTAVKVMEDMEIISGDYLPYHHDKGIRRRFADKFEELLDNLPEDTFSDVNPDVYPDNVKVEPVHPDRIRFGLAFRVTFSDWPNRHYMAKDADEIGDLIKKYEDGEIKE